MTATVSQVERQSSGDFGGPDPAAHRNPLPHALTTIAAHGAAALLLLWPAFWNGYPLVFSDTGTYLGQILMRYLGWDRPPTYSAFLFLLHWKQSLWLPILAQALLTVHLIGLVLRALNRPEPLILLGTAALLAVLTPLPWFVSQLMPDMFTGFVVLTLWLLGFRLGALSLPERIYVLGLAALAVIVHQSHILLGFGLACCGGVLVWARSGWQQAWQPSLRMMTPVLVAALTLVIMNAATRGKPSVSPFGVVFAATRFIYDGPAMDVARRHCPGIGWKFCAVMDRLPDDHDGFLWLDDSPLYRDLGGAIAWAPEAGEIVRQTLAEEPVTVAGSIAANTLRQLMRFGVGDGLEPWHNVGGPAPVIARFFPHEDASFRESLQQTGLLQGDAWRFIPLHAAVLFASLASCLWLLTRGMPRLPFPALALALLVLAALLGNAAITGGLSGPAPRYQGRLIWILPFAVGAIAAGLRLLSAPGPAGLRPRFPG